MLPAVSSRQSTERSVNHAVQLRIPLKGMGTDMIKMIRSNEFVEMFVRVLLKGKSGKVAVLTDDNKLKWEPRSILTQFLNPNNDRTYMTKRIAETLQRTTKLLLESDESSGEMFNRIILLIYSITGVDLTYLYDDSIDDRNKMLLNVMKIIIDSFVIKTKLNNISYLKEFMDYLII